MSKANRLLQLFAAGVFGGGSRLAAYKARALATSPIAYWMLNETSGTTIADSSGNSRNGTYSGVTLANGTSPQGSPAPLWDGVNDYGDIYSASLAGAVSFNEGCLLIWARMSSAAVWTDGVARYLTTINRNGDNSFYIQKLTTSNTLRLLHRSGATTKLVDTTLSTTAWFSAMLSWSQSGNQMIAYINGVQVGSTQTGLIAQTGSGLDSTITNLGSFNQGGFVHSGNLAHVTLWNSPANAAKIALATP